jgi:methylase of polypeptide subunit release factors
MKFVEFKNRRFLVPEIFTEKINETSSFSIYTSNEAENLGRIIKEIRSGKHILLEAVRREAADKLFVKISKRIDEIIPFEDTQRIRSKSFSRNRKTEFETLRNSILDRILIAAESDQVISFPGECSLRNLISFCGEDVYGYSGGKFIFPFRFLKELEISLNEKIFVREIEMNISSGLNVLLPRSQETTGLFRASFENLKNKENLNVIDMGCGSGVLTALADRFFNNSTIYFTDILPESIATTIYNLEKNLSIEFLKINKRIECESRKNRIVCCETGDLFEKTDEKFDVIIFNPPWINSECRNRSERALNDKDQRLIERFIIQSKNALTPGGAVILSYSDNSGENSVENLGRIISSNGFKAVFEKSEKIQSYQSGRKWMKIFVKILSLESE